MAVRRPLRRVGTDLVACTDDDMIRLRYNLRRAYAQMMEGGDTYNVGWPIGKIGTASSIGTDIGSATDNYKTVQYNAGTGRWHYWPTPGSNYGYGPGSDYPSTPGTGTTSTTTTLYQSQEWKLPSGDAEFPMAPSSTYMENTYLVYDSSEGIVMETNEQNIYDTILSDCIEEMHGRSVGSSTGDEIGTYFMTSSSVPNASYLWWTMSDSIVMIDRVHGNSNYATHKLYMKAQHNYSGNNGDDGDGPGTEYPLLKVDSNGAIVNNPIGIGSDLVNKVLVRYLVRNLECEYELTTNSTFGSGVSNRGQATDHYYDSSSTSHQGPGTWGGDNYRTYSTPSGNISAYTTYYLKFWRGT